MFLEVTIILFRNTLFNVKIQVLHLWFYFSLPEQNSVIVRIFNIIVRGFSVIKLNFAELTLKIFQIFKNLSQYLKLTVVVLGFFMVGLG